MGPHRLILEREILPRVEKPARYLGIEPGAVHRGAETVNLRLALAFPDLYDIGLGNLGLLILYDVLNKEPGVWAERVYAPAPDMERALRHHGLPLFALESGDPLTSFHGIGFTLQSELTYTNVLNILDLGGLPLRSRDRRDDHPLIFAGGPGVLNPEPMAPFMDFMVLGDGEEVIQEIARLLTGHVADPRAARLQALSRIPGVYVPALAELEEGPDGSLVPARHQRRIARRVVADLDLAPFPTRPVVPLAPQVHGRIGVEVMRGCTRGCRFCQAGATSRPVRERRPETVAALAAGVLSKAGHDELSLLSLSTCDHSRISDLVEQVAEAADPWRASVSLPSLRLDGFSVDLAERLADVRRTGLTFAPEAATPRMRAVVNKDISDEALLELAETVCSRGWDHLKLYFMIGLPFEEDEDVEAIGRLALRVLARARGVNRKARLNLGVSTFVPKPWTPLQWAEQIPMEETRRRQGVLAATLGGNRAVRFGRHSPEESWLEGILARGDRRAADLVEAAYRLGCRLDAWSEHRRMDLWHRALSESGYRPEWSLRSREPGDTLPWDHMDPLVDKAWLLREWEAARRREATPDCRAGTCQRCGVSASLPDVCRELLVRSEAPIYPRAEASPRLPQAGGGTSRRDGVPAVARMVLRVARLGRSRFLSNRETMDVWVRALRGARAPMAWSQGFHQHPRVAFSRAFPVGEESVGDYLEVGLVEGGDESFIEALTPLLPDGFALMGWKDAPLKGPALMSMARGARYHALLPLPSSLLAERAARLLEATRLEITRAHPKKGARLLDLRPGLAGLEVLPRPSRAGHATLALDLLSPGEGMMPRPREILQLLDVDPALSRLIRLETLTAAGAPFSAHFGIDSGPVTCWEELHL